MFLWVVLIGASVVLTQVEDSRLQPPSTPARHDPVTACCLIVFLAVCLLAVAAYGILAYFRKRLVICADEVRSPHCWSARSPSRMSSKPNGSSPTLHPLPVPTLHGLTVLTLSACEPQQRNGRSSWISLSKQERRTNFLSCSGAGWVKEFDRIWEAFQALREGRASPWSPPVLSVKKWPRLLIVTTSVAVVIGAAFGLLLRIKTPGAAEWTWSGSLLLDWSLFSGLLGLVLGILILSVFCFVEWADLKWRTIQGRRLERAISQAESGAFQSIPDSRSG